MRKLFGMGVLLLTFALVSAQGFIPAAPVQGVPPTAPVQGVPPMFSYYGEEVEVEGKVTGVGLILGRLVFKLSTDDGDLYVLFPMNAVRYSWDFIIDFGEAVKVEGRKLNLDGKSVVAPLKITYNDKTYDVIFPYGGYYRVPFTRWRVQTPYPGFSPNPRFGAPSYYYRDYYYYRGGRSWMPHRGRPNYWYRP